VMGVQWGLAQRKSAVMDRGAIPPV
jgi:hypothetical protein